MSSLILLHGFTGAADSWREVREALPAALQASVHAFDLPGHGAAASTRPADFAATLEWLAARIAATPAPRLLAGYSLGGRLALGLLVERPELATAALLIGVQPGLDRAAAPMRAAADDQWAGDLERHGLEPFLERWQNMALFASQRRLPEAQLAEQAAIRRRQDPAGLAWALRALSPGRMPDYRDRLREVAVPVVATCGGDDDKFLDIARAMAAKLPAGRLHQEPGCGHNLILEAPRAVAGLVAELAGAGLFSKEAS